MQRLFMQQPVSGSTMQKILLSKAIRDEAMMTPKAKISCG